MLAIVYSFAIEPSNILAHCWQSAEEALAHAESIADNDERAGKAASERAFLAYAVTRFCGQDQTEVAYRALEIADNLLGGQSPHRPLLEFRRGLITEVLRGDSKSARAAYERAHIAAETSGDTYLLSYTSRHLGSLAQDAGDTVAAQRYYADSLRHREEAGFLIGIAPALVALASVSAEPEAEHLLAEAARFVRVLGGVPVWLRSLVNVR
jgi:tetratricopeptide (TPR) repeat protein